jgi:hypothetical protein
MPRFIRLRDHKLDLVAGRVEGSERRHSELGRAGEN